MLGRGNYTVLAYIRVPRRAMVGRSAVCSVAAVELVVPRWMLGKTASRTFLPECRLSSSPLLFLLLHNRHHHRHHSTSIQRHEQQHLQRTQNTRRKRTRPRTGRSKRLLECRLRLRGCFAVVVVVRHRRQQQQHLLAAACVDLCTARRSSNSQKPLRVSFVVVVRRQNPSIALDVWCSHTLCASSRHRKLFAVIDETRERRLAAPSGLCKGKHLAGFHHRRAA